MRDGFLDFMARSAARRAAWQRRREGGKAEAVEPLRTPRRKVPAGSADAAGMLAAEPVHPYKQAQLVLGLRMRNLGQAGLTLDGRPATARQVIEEANRLLAAAGKPSIAYPGLTRPRAGGEAEPSGRRPRPATEGTEQ